MARTRKHSQKKGKFRKQRKGTSRKIRRGGAEEWNDESLAMLNTIRTLGHEGYYKWRLVNNGNVIEDYGTIKAFETYFVFDDSTRLSITKKSLDDLKKKSGGKFQITKSESNVCENNNEVWRDVDTEQFLHSIKMNEKICKMRHVDDSGEIIKDYGIIQKIETYVFFSKLGGFSTTKISLDDLEKKLKDNNKFQMALNIKGSIFK